MTSKFLVFLLALATGGLPAKANAYPEAERKAHIEMALDLWTMSSDTLEIKNPTVYVGNKRYSMNMAPGGGWKFLTTPGGSPKEGNCQWREISITGIDPVTFNDRTLRLKQYWPPQIKNARNLNLAKSVILLPPTGGSKGGDELYGGRLCRHGIQVFILKSDLSENLGTKIPDPANSGKSIIQFTEEELSPMYYDRAALRAVVDILHVLKFIGPKHNQQVGLLGTSVGAIMTALNLSVLPQINAGISIMGGVGMSEIIAQSDLTELVELKRQRKAIYQIGENDADYQGWLSQFIVLEPEKYAQRSTGKNLLAMINKDDTTVPGANQKRLVQAFRHDGNSVEVIKWDSGKSHVESIFEAYIGQLDTIQRFFNAHLLDGTKIPAASVPN